MPHLFPNAVKNLTNPLLGFVVFACCCKSASAEDAYLRWRNGDELAGQILPGEAGKIHWKAQPFSRPLQLNLRQLESIRFSSENRNPTAKDEATFRILLKNGDRLDGSLHAMDESSVTVNCAPFANPVVVRRDAIERIVHISSSSLHYSGPGDLGQWTSDGRDRKTTEWFTDLKGAFSTNQWSGNLFREIEFPSLVEIQFRAEIPSGNPNLEIGLIRGADQGPMIETWDNYLVLTHQTRFVPVMEINDDTRALDFRLFWNQESGQLRLCEPSGKLLASLDDALVQRRDHQSTKPRASDPLIRGFWIMNRTPELKLHSVTVQEWNGKPVPIIDLSKPRVHLMGQPPQFGVDQVQLTAGSNSIRVGGRSHPIDNLQEIILSPTAKKTVEASLESVTRIAWFGGTTVSGNFLNLRDDFASVAPDWSEAPVDISLKNAREIRFPQIAEAPIGSEAFLEGDGIALHGSIEPLAQKEGNKIIGWLPPGATEPVPFADDISGKVTRTPHAAAARENSNFIGQGRVYLENDEILVGSLISITKSKVHFTSRITGLLEIPVELVRAVDIGEAGRVLEGFGDSEWEVHEKDENDITLARNTASIRAGAFGNPSLLLGDRLSFTTKWDQAYGAITLRLFTDTVQESAPSTDIIIAAQGNRLFVGKLKDNGAFSFSGDQIPIVGDQAKFEFTLEPKKVRIIVNGKSTLNIATDPDNVSGNGIFFKMGGGWQGWNQNENEVTLSDFRIERAPGSLPRRIIDPKAKQNALTVPRSRRDPVPTHVLVAPNGDLLRGKLEAASGNEIRFSTGDGTLELPRTRVSAIVWLRPPVPGEEPEQEPLVNQEKEGEEEVVKRPMQSFDHFPVTHQFTLMDGSRLRLQSERIENSRFVGKSAILGDCIVSIGNIREMRRGPATPAHELEKSGISAFSDWQLTLTPDPDIPTGENTQVSPLIGKPAPPIKLSQLGKESNFELSKHKGRVVVLDFWATWCGPCIKAIPDVQKVVGAFPQGSVVFQAVNQAETVPIITGFLEARKWQDLPVSLDFDLMVSNAYLVDGIPHTVVIGRDGKVAWTHSGYSEDLKMQLFDAVAAELQK